MDHFLIQDTPGLPASEQTGSLRASGLATGTPGIIEGTPIALVPSTTRAGDRILVAEPGVLGDTLEQILVATHLLVAHDLTLEVLDPRLTIRPDMLPALSLLKIGRAHV